MRWSSEWVAEVAREFDWDMNTISGIEAMIAHLKQTIAKDSIVRADPVEAKVRGLPIAVDVVPGGEAGFDPWTA